MRSITILVILDGWGIGSEDESNAIHTAETPNMDYIQSSFFGGALKASGVAVGLPWGVSGDSDRGHIILGTGQIPSSESPIQNSISEIVSSRDYSQLKITEEVREKHITFFLNGRNDNLFQNEFQVILPSMQDVNPTRHPEMASTSITDRALMSIREGGFDFIVVNYPNADVMAHTGNIEATIIAIQSVDAELGRLISSVTDSSHTLIITADHGNADQVLDKRTGRADKEHTKNPVPFYVVGNQFEKNRDDPSSLLRPKNIGLLIDVAPTVLGIMGIDAPPEMTGSNLLSVS
jgi:2,3-bisphosphoglycerate-independent phosphoglycerate mutase